MTSTNPNTGEVAEARDFLQVLGDMPNTVIDLTDKFQAMPTASGTPARRARSS